MNLQMGNFRNGATTIQIYFYASKYLRKALTSCTVKMLKYINDTACIKYGQFSLDPPLICQIINKKNTICQKISKNSSDSASVC